MPVDDDKDGALAREAVKGHLANFRMPDFITEFKFRDDALPYDPSFTSASFSPYNYLDEIPKDVAVYAISGWMDGAGYANGTLSRFLTLPNAQRRVMLGPWDHGARVNASPWRARVEPELPVLGEVLRFFDQHLAGREHRPRRRGPHPLLRRACRGMARGQELAAGEGQPAVLHRARPPARRARSRTTRTADEVPGRLHASAAARRRATSASPASTRPPTTPTGRSAKRKLLGFTTEPLDSAARDRGPSRGVAVARLERARRRGVRLSLRGRGRRHVALRHRGRAARHPSRRGAGAAQLPHDLAVAQLRPQGRAGRCRSASRSSCASPCCRRPGASPRAAASGSRSPAAMPTISCRRRTAGRRC